MAQTDMFDETRGVERQQFFSGQPLFASDLDGISGFNRAMRWLHNRSLHQPGIGNGFAVSGRKGDREVHVQAGYALDSRGREIVLLDTDVEPVPPVAAERDGTAVYFDLTVAYPSDDELEEAETREGVCLPRGVVRLRERPVFCWVRLERVNGRLVPVSPAQRLAIQAGLQIVLTRAQVRNCRLDADLSIAERRNARPLAQPHLECGHQQAAWVKWVVQSVPIGLLAPVDTSAARFRVTPCYSARVDGPRPLVLPHTGGGGGGPINVAIVAPDLVALELPAFVQDASPVGFTCYLAIWDIEGRLTEALLDRLAGLAVDAWGVTWLGIED